MKKAILCLSILSAFAVAKADIFSGGNPPTPYVTPAYVGYEFPASQNFVVAVSSDILFNTFTLTAPATVTGIRYSIGTVAANTAADFGIYSSTPGGTVGTLVGHTGSFLTAGTTGIQTSTMTAINLSPGIYEIAAQVANVNIQLAGVQGGGTSTNPFCAKNTATTLGLPNSITLPGTAGTRCIMMFGVVSGGAL